MQHLFCRRVHHRNKTVLINGENPTEVEVMQVVKEVVIKINELNIEHDHFIETMEREDLYEFIDTAARIAGLESEEDITEEWREW